MKLKTKMLVGFTTVIVIFLLISGNVMYTFNLQKNNLEDIVGKYYERVSLAQSLKFNVQAKSRIARDYLLRGNQVITAQELEIINDHSNEANLIFDRLQTMASDDPEVTVLVEELKLLNSRYREKIDTALDYMLVGHNDAAINLLITDNQIRSELLVGLDTLTLKEEATMEAALDHSMEIYQSTMIVFISLITVGIIIVMVISVTMMRSFTNSINRVRNVMAHIPSTSFEKLPRIKMKTKDEFYEVATTYNEMADALEVFAKNEKELNASLQDENWVKTKFSELATKIQGAQKLETFGKMFMTTIAPMIEANYGVFYLKNEKRKVFTEVCSYAVNGENNIRKKSFELGEGLIGQCALNNDVILIEKVPENYIKIRSGLGNATPTSLMIMPIQFEDEVIGVLELAKFTSFTPLHRHLLEQVCRSIGPNLNRITNHMEIARLLSESQALTEELQTQSEELQQQQEELRTINEELHEENTRTEEKSKELEIAKLELEQKNREILLSSKYKSEFLANMSHELRTPLNSMLILSQILAENSDKNLSSKQVEYAETIHSSGKDLLTLINDILDLAKIESGKIDVYPEQIQLEDIKSFVERQFSPISNYKGIDFHIYVEKNTPETIFTDDQRLKQILKNLLSNAFKFTDIGNVTLKISPGNVITNSKIVFSIIDTGIGIETSKHEIIFDAFNQVDGTTSRKFGGTGLGLSISRELSQLLGGSIKVTSTVGKGSTFSLYLPDYENYNMINETKFIAATTEDAPLMLNETEESTHSNLVRDDLTNDVSEQLANKNVLIVDDDMRNVFALTSVLEKQNMNVIFAENGIEALETLNRKKIDIVLMDIMMPEMDGYEAMNKIRQNEHLKELPIIALTAKAMKNDREKCLNAGATDYISKPVDIKQLLSLIKVWLCK